MTFDDLIEAINAQDFATLIRSSGDGLPELLNKATELFDTYPRADQATAMAIMLGMMFAAMEGEHSEAEREMGVIITSVERFRIFMARYGVAYRESIQARLDDPDSNRTKGPVM